MLAALLLSAFAVYGFFSFLISLSERCADAVAVRGERGETKKSLCRRLHLASRCGREAVILLDDGMPSEEMLSLGYAVYLRVPKEKGDPGDGI